MLMEGALPYAHGVPTTRGTIKSDDADFQVDEVLSFAPNGDGEHVFLKIRKSGTNTEFLARQLARFSQVPASSIAYAGLKDRHGLTTQWFSVWLPGKPEPDWSAFDTDNIRVVEVTRNQRKLRRGCIAENRFRLTIRSITDSTQALETRLQRVSERGVPNYFGAQRFGREGANLDSARRLLSGDRTLRCSRHQRGLYLSAARAHLFNRILAARVESATWDHAIAGDAFMFSSGHSVFHSDAASPDIAERIAAMTIHPAGTLWGSGQRWVRDEAMRLEERALADEAELCAGLEAAGLALSMRPLRVVPSAMEWQLTAPDTLTVRFGLPAGTYATAVLREVVDFDDAGLPEPSDTD